MRIVELRGNPRQMGEQFGEACREEIQRFYRLRVENALRQAKSYGDRDVSESQLLAVAQACEPPTQAYDPADFDELAGIAKGAQMSITQILAMNGLTDLRDILAWHGDLESFGGCSSFLAGGNLSSDGLARAGQTWDLATDNMPFVLLVKRAPEEGPSTRSLTTTGCLTLIGMNSEGIAVGTTNLRTTDARAGVTYLSILHKAMAQQDLAAAKAAVHGAQRAGAHYYFLMDRNGEGVGIECTAKLSHELPLTSDGSVVHCNHALVAAHAQLEGSQPSTSSHYRQERLEGLLSARQPARKAGDFESYMGNGEDGENSICRDDFGGISTNGAVVMTPQDGGFRACHGLPNQAEWVSLA